ncbi:condensin complex subunit 1-like isoform X2 [Lingula anatina]|uniref:Condensin complex subunit 1 n=1 Tax=Lingula anatina TaxID=7574 RepID=A0A1S3JXH4_LINAN|nr:condensin complex subunit 1-like isoform X2 [Lingula anatina]|eukprot:XP_013415078.1 condensin complex subunit 1-like isoform X2 [Lingula anatina]
MSFDFTLPLCKDDLLNRTGASQYVVDEVYSIRQLPGKLQECRSAFRAKGPRAMLEAFDSLFSVLTHQHNIEFGLREETWELLLKVMTAHCSQLPAVLDGELDSTDRLDHLNILKMTTYLLCQFVESFEAEATKPSVNAATKGRGKAKKKEVLTGWDWEAEREKSVQTLLQVLQLNLNRLWDPPVAEEEFVNLVTCCCYKLLENPSVTKNRVSKDAIFHLLGTMVKKYNHGLGASLKIIQLLQHFEHLSSPLAQGLELFVTELGLKGVVGEIMRELGKMDPRDLARDNSGTRAYAAFMVELAERIPEVMLPNISVLIPLLDGESYSMRNGVLGVLGEILVKVLSKEDLDANLKNTRDQFLDKLEDHIHDVHAFVRSKVLQVWLTVVNEKALPLPRQHHLVDLVIGRLQDRSSQVRKYAVQLITALLRSNPFAAKLSVEDLKENYEKERDKLKEMMPETLEESGEAEDPLAGWKTMEPELMAAIVKVLEQPKDGDEEEENIEEEMLIEESETIESVVERIHSHIKAQEAEKAVRLLQVALEAWPTYELFLIEEEGRDEEKDEQEEDEVEVQKSKLLKCLQAVFISEDESTVAALARVTEAAQEQQEAPETAIVNEVSKQQVLVQYLKDTMTFVSQIQTATPVICQLLGSKNVTDVMEAIEFFVTGFEFGVSNAMTGIRRMLALVWSKEAGIKEGVVDAYKRLYLRPQGGNQRAKSLAIVNNLVALCQGASVGDLTSLEELIAEFVKSEDLGHGVIQMLWEKFTLKIQGTTAEESRLALVLLGMAAGAQVDIIHCNVEVLLKEGLGPRAEEDFQLVRDTCLALQKIAAHNKTKPGQAAAEPFRFPQQHAIFQRLADIIVNGVTKLEDCYWIPMAEQAVNTTYKLAEHPDAICGTLIKRLADVVMKMNQTNNKMASEENKVEEKIEDHTEGKGEGENEVEDHTEGEGQTEPSQGQDLPLSQNKEFTCPSGVLTRLLSLAGHVALRQLVFLDNSVMGELKRRNMLREADSGKKKSKDTTVNTTASSNTTKDTTQQESIEEELGLTGATADDAEAEYIRKICETDIVTGRNLLAILRPLLVAVCNNQVKYPDPELRTAATLALAKFMMVSSEFCEAHLQLLFTILEKSQNPVIRANTIITLGDLTFRFPNLIEPWTPHLYARLRDDSPQVRKNTMMVLTHLILNDMVKVKGQISEMATCLCDPDPRIAGLARLFFHELSKKGNAVYNIMPDVISRLSDPDVGVEEENFKTIMKYLFSFIQKDKQCESLVEKLCHRFRATRTERQWRDLSFCLSMLSYNEKSIRKLQENFACFGDKLHEEEVYSCFTTIISGAKKFAKPETKAMVEEFEQRLEECHTKGMDDEAAMMKATKASAAAAAAGGRKNRGKTPAKTPGKGKKGRGRTTRRFEDSDEESDQGGEGEEEGAETEEVSNPAARGRHKAAGKAKPALVFSDDSDIELYDVSGKEEKTVEVEEEEKDSDAENTNPNVDSPSPLPVRKPKKSVSCRRPEVIPKRGTRASRSQKC